MSVAKSGTIRKAIGPIRKRLEDNVRSALILVNTDIPSETESAQQFVNKIELATARLSASVTSLSERDKQWSDLMVTLDDATVVIEEGIYEQTASSATGYITILEEGKEVINLLAYKQRQTDQFLRSNPISAASGDLSSSCRKTSAKLPKLELPLFSGDPIDWQHFWAVFEANVHNTSLTGVEKFSYLKSRLRDAAMNAIGGLPITEEAYKIAIDILKNRFHRSPEQLVSNLYGQLKRLPPSSDRGKDMRRTFDSCEKILRQLKDASEDIESNRSLVLDIWSKYPEQVLADLTHRKAVSAQSTLTQVQAALEDYIEEADSLTEMLHDLQPFHRDASKGSGGRRSSPSRKGDYRSSGGQAANYGSSNSWNRDRSNQSTALSVSAVQSNQESYPPQTPKSPCYFCGSQHFNSQCDRYPTAEQRLQRLSEVKRCLRCLDSTHPTAECRTRPGRIRCHFCQTTGAHPSPMCPTKFGKSSCHLSSDVRSTTGGTGKQQQKSTNGARNDGNTNVRVKSNTSTSHTPCVLGVEEQALLATAVTMIRNPDTGAERPVRVILDNGCPRTFILDSVAKELGLRSQPSRNLYISAFGCKRTATHSSLQLRFDMQLRDGNVMAIEANTVELIVNRSAQPDKLPDATQRLTESLGYAMADNRSNEGPPEVLIGSDYFWQMIPCNRMTTDDGIYLISSGLGLLLGGRYQTEGQADDDYPSLLCLTERTGSTQIETSLSSITTVSKSNQEYPDIDEFWSLERIGIADDPLENDDELAQAQFDETVKFEEGRYQVCWPWKEDQSRLPTNYNLAVGRLRSLAKRLAQSGENLCLEYDKTITEQLKRGIIEKVPDEERLKTPNAVHYLPHHPVVRAGHNTTKVRIVYDASAKYRKDHLSLNECLYRGPVILPDLCSILLRFRLHEIAIVADIEKAFLQLGLQASQRDVTRFLWFRDSTRLEVDNNIETYRFQRVPFGAISSPFLLAATVQHHLKQSGSLIATEIRNNIYVDNVISGTHSEVQAIAYYDESKRIFNAASMNLREWCSNSSKLHEHIPEVDQSAKRTVKVLGLDWNSESDQMQLRNSWPERADCQTKRDVLKAIASVYDPLGWFQPCTLQAKCFLRDLWNDGVGWDDRISEAYQSKWKSLHADIAPMFDVKIARRLNHVANGCDIGLAIFSDASKDAYATAVYLRTRDPSVGSRWSTRLIYSKSRLTPKSHPKSMSLPKLELLGLTIAAKAADFVRSSLQRQVTTPCYLFCDSVCVLSWLRTEKPLQRFVANRVNQIRCLDDVEYHYVRSSDNPADVCTRGLTGVEIACSSFWWDGPDWLKDDVSEWPTNQPIEAISDVEFLKETKLSDHAISLIAGEGLYEKQGNPFEIDPSNISSLQRLLRVSAWCLKFIKKVWWNNIEAETRPTKQLGGILEGVSDDDHITSPDIVQSQIMWIKAVQSDCFGEVKEALRLKKPNQLVGQLNLQIDSDGLIRCCGRLKNADLPPEAVAPVLLPKSNPLTSLIIADVHEKLYHSGVSHTLSQIRRQFWVLQGRSAVRRVLTRCVLCRRNKGPPFALPNMPPWPRERVARSRPFQFTGLDYLGPINVKSSEGTTVKMWCCLFTCLAVRAIHLECVTDCTAQTFVECLSRFIARRGCPQQIISDNGPQFRLAKTLIDRTWRNVASDDIVKSYIAERGIIWKFITELAPWQGGFYERLVGVVKSTFKSMIGRRMLIWDEFITLITETEAIVNSRPITYVHGDIDSGTALRPMDFIVDLPTGTTTVDPKVPLEGGDATKFLFKFWKSKQKRLDAVWDQWYDHYLMSLRERDQATHKGHRSAIPGPPAVGEVVILKNTETPRGHWKLARVLSLIPSQDGSVRSAQLKLPNSLTVKRPINHLYRLELPSSIETNAEVPVNTPEADGEDFLGFDIAEVEAAERAAQVRHDDMALCCIDAAHSIEDNLSPTVAL